MDRFHGAAPTPIRNSSRSRGRATAGASSSACPTTPAARRSRLLPGSQADASRSRFVRRSRPNYGQTATCETTKSLGRCVIWRTDGSQRAIDALSVRDLVPRAGLEPAHACARRILSSFHVGYTRPCLYKTVRAFNESGRVGLSAGDGFRRFWSAEESYQQRRSTPHRSRGACAGSQSKAQRVRNRTRAKLRPHVLQYQY